MSAVLPLEHSTLESRKALLVLLAPLAQKAGGWGLCREPKTREPRTVFADPTDPDYLKLLALCVAGQERLEQIKRFDMPGFQPRRDWVREMQRYGILPQTVPAAERIDVYATERKYWTSLWYRPPVGAAVRP
jgi:hypothetical protein